MADLTGAPAGARRIINWTDLLAGLGMAVLCGAFVLFASDYGIGRLARIGPGFYPTAFGLVGVGLGILIVIGSFLSAGEAEAPLRWRPLLFVSAGIAAFTLMVEPVGLLPAVFVSTVINALADRRSRLPGTLLLAVFLTAGVWLVFVVLLGLPIRLIGDFG
jgi:hypothetical protein